jgi:hypothetical protein
MAVYPQRRSADWSTSACVTPRSRGRQIARDIELAPGTVLMREWGDRDHKVTVTAEGTFEYEGKFFKSLSAVARHISGTQWSGPLFFGLKTNRTEAA